MAVALSLMALLAARGVAERVFERMPHIEDEMAYVWQAQVLAQGKLTLPSPPAPRSMLVPFVVDYEGRRFAKYPPGWPLVLAGGIVVRARDWVNPVLAALGVWFTYRLGKKVLDEGAALLAALLTLTSPFFLLNSGSLLSHPWALFLSLVFSLSWLEAFDPRRAHPEWRSVLLAALSLGLLALTRPLTALGVALPFFVHGLILLWRGARSVRLALLGTGLLVACVAALVPLWQFAVSGDAFLNPYTLWWPYDKVGFGEGFGRQEGGHSLSWAWVNLRSSLDAGRKDFFGWGSVSWLFLPFGMAALGRHGRAWLVASIFPALVLVYMFYWIGATLYGPRYYYEGFYSLTLLSAAGMRWLARGTGPGRRLRRAMTILLCAFLFGYNLMIYLPRRLEGMSGLYGIRRAMLAPFETEAARALTPALVIVHFQKQWTEYGGLLELENADLTSPFIFALARGPSLDEELARAYPSRRILHYYPNEPNRFYAAER